MLKSEKIILTKDDIYVFSGTRYKMYTPCKIFPLTLINLTYIKKSTKYRVRLEHSFMLTLFKKKIKSTGYESKNDTLTIFAKSSNYTPRIDLPKILRNRIKTTKKILKNDQFASTIIDKILYTIFLKS